MHILCIGEISTILRKSCANLAHILRIGTESCANLVHILRTDTSNAQLRILLILRKIQQASSSCRSYTLSIVVSMNKKPLFRVQPIVFNNSLLFYSLFCMKIDICFLYKGVSYSREPAVFSHHDQFQSNLMH